MEVKLFGPLHRYVAPPGLAVKLSVWPAHKGELLPTVGVPGIGFTVTLMVPAELVQPATVENTEYVPVANVLAPARVGF